MPSQYTDSHAVRTGTENRSGHVALGAGAGAYHLVDRELLARIDDITVERSGHQLDVADPGLAAVVIGGETGDALDLRQLRRLDRLQIGQCPDEEGRHLCSSHRRMGAVLRVGGRVAAFGDPGGRQCFDVTSMDRVPDVGEARRLDGGFETQRLHEESGHLPPGDRPQWAEAVVLGRIASPGDVGRRHMLDGVFEDRITDIRENAVVDLWQRKRPVEEGGHLASGHRSVGAEDRFVVVAAARDAGGSQPFDGRFVDAALVVIERAARRELLLGEGRNGGEHEQNKNEEDPAHGARVSQSPLHNETAYR